eukprot:1161652-Pelagomonas_calceolata.AAC.5
MHHASAVAHHHSNPKNVVSPWPLAWLLVLSTFWASAGLLLNFTSHVMELLASISMLVELVYE